MASILVGVEAVRRFSDPPGCPWQVSIKAGASWLMG